ncbi:sensor histidine kinase [Ekhidna sp.]|uniref:sensor histidine kinase n=1 Tax=Ekhidna sp. TaxID=2608089 RepID=UPI003C7B4090
MTTREEHERILELESYSILDTLSDKDYDNLTALAAEICQTPISLISLVDKERQWFKSHHGLSVSETPRIHSFCAHAIEQPQKLFYVKDARDDTRFLANPLVTGDPYIVFYAGVPLTTQNGHSLGTLCVIDQKPKELSESQVRALEVLSKQVMSLLELRKSRFELKSLNARLEAKNEMLQKFADIAAAKINSPLNIMAETYDEFMKKYGDQIGEEGEKKLKPAKEAGRKLKEMVEALNDHAKIPELKRLKNDMIDLEEMGERLRNCFPQSDDYEINYVFHIKSVTTNRAMLEEILMQLMSNAIRHNDKPMAEVEVGARELDFHYEFYVLDNGPGIPEEKIPKVFEMFTSFHPIGRMGDYSLGVGLGHAKNLVEELGGELDVNSDEGEGTIISFSIPK